jgi:hypothetical protein
MFEAPQRLQLNCKAFEIRPNSVILNYRTSTEYENKWTHSHVSCAYILFYMLNFYVPLKS